MIRYLWAIFGCAALTAVCEEACPTFFTRGVSFLMKARPVALRVASLIQTQVFVHLRFTYPYLERRPTPSGLTGQGCMVMSSWETYYHLRTRLKTPPPGRRSLPYLARP